MDRICGTMGINLHYTLTYKLLYKTKYIIYIILNILLRFIMYSVLQYNELRDILYDICIYYDKYILNFNRKKHSLFLRQGYKVKGGKGLKSIRINPLSIPIHLHIHRSYVPMDILNFNRKRMLLIY